MIMSLKNSNDTNGNRTRYLPACSEVSNNNNNNLLGSFLTKLETICRLTPGCLGGSPSPLDTIYRLTPGCLGGSPSPLDTYYIYKYFFLFSHLHLTT